MRFHLFPWALVAKDVCDYPLSLILLDWNSFFIVGLLLYGYFSLIFFLSFSMKVCDSSQENFTVFIINQITTMLFYARKSEM